MLQSIHKGQSIIMQSLQSLGFPSIMSMEEFEAQVDWLGGQPSSSRGGGASAAQEPDTEEPPTPTPSPAAVEEKTTPDQTPQPSPTPTHIPEDAAPVAKPEQLIQDSSVAPALDLNEDQPQEDQDV